MAFKAPPLPGVEVIFHGKRLFPAAFLQVLQMHISYVMKNNKRRR
jgi:hypothetical protein